MTVGNFRRINMKLSREVLKKMKHYVYLLSDPDTDEIFYVGEGKGSRVFSHFKETEDSNKVRQIRKIKSQGREPRIEILAHGLEKAEALKIETAVIDLIGKNKLTNKVRGHKSSAFGRMDLDQIKAKYTSDKANITEKVLLIKLSTTFSYGMTPLDLYEHTRSSWPVSPAGRKNVTHAFAVYDGIIQETYNVLQWFEAGTTYMKRRDIDIDSHKSQRWEFIGSISEEMRKKYRYKSVEHYWKKSSENSHSYPFTYTFDK